MTSEQCYQRASECAATAAIAPAEDVALEFMKLAAQWRSMAVRETSGCAEVGPPEPEGR